MTRRNQISAIILICILAGAVVAAIVWTRHQRQTQARDEARAAAVEATDELLDKPISADFHGALGDALGSLQREYGLRLIVRWDLLAKDGVTAKTAVNINLRKAPLAVVLRALCYSTAQYTTTPIVAVT